mgnify:CR=1 FL=1
MLIRYKTGKNGKPEACAKVYTAAEHGIALESLDVDAVKVAGRLRRHGYQAYIVGGAVRDLLMGKIPKDFDMATNASPQQIRKIFRNSRIIGKRFRLVHIFFQQKIIEVTTFRSLESSGFNAVFGSIEEDAKRRDFSLNSLYYDTHEQQILDFTGGFEDIKKGIVRPVIPVRRIFSEDPVRMIRAIKYTVKAGFVMQGPLRRRLKRSASLLADIPDSRLTEEVFKILLSGNSASILRECAAFGLLPHILPGLHAQYSQEKNKKIAAQKVFAPLERLDACTEIPDALEKGNALAYLFANYVYTQSQLGQRKRIPIGDIYSEMKTWVKPVTPANKDVDVAAHIIAKKRSEYLERGVFSLSGIRPGTDPKKKMPRRRRPRIKRSE